MRVEFRLPDIGEGMTEGEVVRWLVREGEEVKEDQPIAEVQTDKAIVEIPSPVQGRVSALMADEGEVVNVGAVLLTFDVPRPEEKGSHSETSSRSGGGTDESAKTTQPLVPAASASAARSPSAAGALKGKALATPAVRKLARELGVDLARVRPSGEGGRITAEDVRGHLALAAGSPPAAKEEKKDSAENRIPLDAERTGMQAADERAGQRVALRGLRRSIANHMSESVRHAVHCTAMDEMDVTELVRVRRQMSEKAAEKGVKLTYLPFIMKAVVAGLKEFPYLNATLLEEEGEILLHREYHLGMATDTEEGLLVPVVREADRKSLLQLAQEVALLAEKARGRKLSPTELKGSTFTITNIGALGGLFSTPIINYPEVGILAVQKIQEKPVVREGQIVIREMMGVSLSFDHRVTDGATAARFLLYVKRYLEQPNLLFMEMV